MANKHHERVVRADYAYYAARMDWKDGEACKHLDKLDREMREAEDKLNDANTRSDASRRCNATSS